MAKRGRIDGPQPWHEALTEENLARTALEATKDAEGKISGYRLVWARSDQRGKAPDMEYTSPYLHVSGGDTFMHGRCFKKDDPTQRFTRWLTIKTSEGFDKAAEWAEAHPDIVDENQRYYAAVQTLVQRVTDLTFELPSVRDPLIVEAIKELRKKDIVAGLNAMKAERRVALLEVLKNKPSLMARAAEELTLDKHVSGWRDKAAEHLAKKKDVVSTPEVAKEVGRKMASQHKDSVIQKLLENPEFADDPELVEGARIKHEDAFTSWVFKGKAAEGESEAMEADPEPGKTHRAKMRAFFKPRRSSKDTEARDLSHTTTPVDVHPNAIESSGLDGKSVFHLEEDARQQGYQTRRIDWIGKFSKKETVKMHDLPNGTKVPWYKDPRVHFCRPGSVVRLQVSFFVYVKPHAGMRMQFGRYVVLSHRGPPFGREAPKTNDDELSDVESGDEDDEGGGATSAKKPETIAPVHHSKKPRTEFEAMDGDGDNSDLDGDFDEDDD